MSLYSAVMKRFRSFWVLLLVLAYAGQALAALASPCRPMAGAVSGQMDMPAMAHAGHNMPPHGNSVTDNPGPAAPPADCCEAGLCAMSHCQSAPAMPPEHSGSRAQYSALYPPIESAATPIHPIDSFYRPPISR